MKPTLEENMLRTGSYRRRHRSLVGFCGFLWFALGAVPLFAQAPPSADAFARSASVGSGAATFPRFAYVANSGDKTISIFSVNASTGQLSSQGYRLALGSTPVAVAVDPSGSFAYAVNFDSNRIRAFRINSSSGVLSPSGPALVTGTHPSAGP